MRPVLLALPLSLALGACSGGDTRSATTPRPSATVVPSTAAPSPTAVATTGAPSPTSSPTPAVRRAAIDGDVDGDGTPDAVKATTTLLTVTLSASGKRVTAPVHADSPAAPEVLGSTDVDRDGRAEVFVKTVQGASTGFATPYRFDGTALRELTLDGQPALLGFGGGAQHGDGFRCTDAGQIEVRKAEADQAGTTFTVELSVYRLSPTALVRVRTTTSTAAQGSAELEASYTIDCGSVGEGG